jgi:hypothetical protein
MLVLTFLAFNSPLGGQQSPSVANASKGLRQRAVKKVILKIARGGCKYCVTNYCNKQLKVHEKACYIHILVHVNILTVTNHTDVV